MIARGIKSCRHPSSRSRKTANAESRRPVPMLDAVIGAIWHLSSGLHDRHPSISRPHAQ